MKRRTEDSSCEFTKTQFVTKSASEHHSRGIDKIAVRLPSGGTDWLANGASRLISAGDTVGQQRCAHFFDDERVTHSLGKQKSSQAVKI
jgi:hypothetical protein